MPQVYFASFSVCQYNEQAYLSHTKSNMEHVNKRRLGEAYEQKACDFIEEEGLRVIERNYRTPLGEIDIIARDREELVFLEVKYRKSRDRGGAEYAISRDKQRTIIKVAKMYIKMHRLPLRSFYRFDAVLIDGEEITHIRNAWQES